MSMVRRAIPYASSLDEANQIVRGNWLEAIEKHHQQHSGNSEIGDVLDIGCSVGVSTRFLADKFASAKVTVCLDTKEKLICSRSCGKYYGLCSSYMIKFSSLYS